MEILKTNLCWKFFTLKIWLNYPTLLLQIILWVVLKDRNGIVYSIMFIIMFSLVSNHHVYSKHSKHWLLGEPFADKFLIWNLPTRCHKILHSDPLRCVLSNLAKFSFDSNHRNEKTSPDCQIWSIHNLIPATPVKNQLIQSQEYWLVYPGLPVQD